MKAEEIRNVSILGGGMIGSGWSICFAMNGLNVILGAAGAERRLENAEATAELLNLADILIDGPFILAQRDLTLQFRGSANQRIIDLDKTRATGHLTLWKQE